MSRLPCQLLRVTRPAVKSLSQHRLRAGYFVREVSRGGPRPCSPSSFQRPCRVRAVDREPSEAHARSSDRSLCTLPCRHRRTYRQAICLRSRRTAGQVSRTAALGPKCQYRRSRQPGGTIEEEPLLCIILIDDLFDLPQCPSSST